MSLKQRAGSRTWFAHAAAVMAAALVAHCTAGTDSGETGSATGAAGTGEINPLVVLLRVPAINDWSTGVYTRYCAGYAIGPKTIVSDRQCFAPWPGIGTPSGGKDSTDLFTALSGRARVLFPFLKDQGRTQRSVDARQIYIQPTGKVADDHFKEGLVVIGLTEEIPASILAEAEKRYSSHPEGRLVWLAGERAEATPDPSVAILGQAPDDEFGSVTETAYVSNDSASKFTADWKFKNALSYKGLKRTESRLGGAAVVSFNDTATAVTLRAVGYVKDDCKDDKACPWQYFLPVSGARDFIIDAHNRIASSKVSDLPAVTSYFPGDALDSERRVANTFPYFGEFGTFFRTFGNYEVDRFSTDNHDAALKVFGDTRSDIVDCGDRTIQFGEKYRFEWTCRGTTQDDCPIRTQRVQGGHLGRWAYATRYGAAAPGTGTLRDGFKKAYESSGGVAVLGLPLTDEIKEDLTFAGSETSENVAVQYFERAKLIWHNGEAIFDDLGNQYLKTAKTKEDFCAKF